MHHQHHWRGGGGGGGGGGSRGGLIPFEDEEVPGYADNMREPMSRVLDLDSLEPDYRRAKDIVPTMNLGAKPLPPPPPLSPPPPSCLSSDCPPPPPPPPPPKKFSKIIPVTRLTNNSRRKSRARKRNVMDNTHASRGAYAWSVTSSMYWKLLVVLQVVFSIADVVHDGTIMLYYQRVFLMFLFSTAISIIVGMYVYTMYTKSPSSSAAAAAMDTETSCQKSHANNHNSHNRNRSFTDTELGGSLSSTLRRAYIRRHALCRTNFHLRLGAVVFGIATLIYFGFEISVHATNKRTSCVDDVVYSLPIVLVILCFLQIHFLFVNSQVLVGSLRGPAQFCFAHMLATNLALWLKIVGSQSAMKWVTFTSEAPIKMANENRTRVWWPRYKPSGNEQPTINLDKMFGAWSAMAPPEFERIATFTGCLQNTTLGQMWLQATPFLVPFLLQFCVVSAAVFYVLWSSMSHSSAERYVHADASLTRKTSVATQCQMENKGIFVGLLLLVGGIVVLVMYLILRAEPQFVNDSLWVVSGTLCLVLAVATLALLIGFLKMQGVAYARDAPRISHLDTVLTSATSAGPLLYSVLGLVVSASHLDTNDDVLVMAHGGLLLIEVFLQNVFVAERWRRVPNRAGQQMIQVMLFANAALWLLDTFMTSSGDSQKLQEQFYGPLLWGILSYSSTPLIALYRFHSTIQLYELWKRSHT